MDGNPLKLVPIVSSLEKLEAKNQCCVSGMVYSGSGYEFLKNFGSGPGKSSGANRIWI